MTLVYIHGASATSESFNYLRQQIGGQDIAINYDSHHGFDHNLASMKQQLADIRNIFFVAHSLGGIYSLHLANNMPKQVLGAVTLSTPYGGAEVADYAKYFIPFSRLMRDIGPASDPMRQAEKIKVQHPWTNIITVKGQSPWMLAPNDGVVTIASQRAHPDMELIEVDYNHYEVVLTDSVVDIIKQRINTHKGKQS
jgi:pimeloyl-ACP methyl ester carboxylesterase